MTAAPSPVVLTALEVLALRDRLRAAAVALVHAPGDAAWAAYQGLIAAEATVDRLVHALPDVKVEVSA